METSGYSPKTIAAVYLYRPKNYVFTQVAAIWNQIDFDWPNLIFWADVK